MRGSGSGPAAQKDIKANAKIDERNQPQPVVERTFRRNQNDAGIEWDRLPEQGIGCFGPDTVSVELALEAGNILDFLPVDGNQLIARLDATLGARSIRIDAIGREPPGVLDPPDSIVRNRGSQFCVEIEAGEYDSGYRQQEQKNGNEADLAFAVHGLRRRSRTLNGLDRRGNYVPPVLNEQLRCHVVSHFRQC